MHRSFRYCAAIGLAALLSACGGNASNSSIGVSQSLIPASKSVASSPQNLVVDGIPVHALFPKGNAKTASGGNLVYHGGPIQKNPVIYVVYWGFTDASADPYGVAPYLTSFLKGMTGNSYFDIVTQYYSTAAGNITDPKGQFGGEWFDNSTIPNQPSGSQIAAEAVKAAQHFGYTYDASYIVQLPHGAINHLGYCAYHSVTSTSMGDVHYTDLPYQPDYPGCGTNSVNTGAQGQLDSTSETAAHEVAETQTDPDTRNGWYDAYGNEIGDYCAYINLQNLKFSTGTFAIQPLWSNAANYCAVTYP